jgi:hypothetical protein
MLRWTRMDRHCARRVRTIQTAYRLAVRLRPQEAKEDAREQLDRVAIEIEPESDPALQELLDEVRAEIEGGGR